MNKFKKSLVLLPAFLLLISGCTPKEDGPSANEETTSQDMESSDNEKGDEKDNEGSSAETVYDAAYALYGDFTDSSWNESPSEGSIYYLPYSTSDKSTMYWERSVTISSAAQSWDAGFRVIEYGKWSNTVINYSNITSDSTGVSGPGNDNNIIVSWGETYDLVIDCTGTSNKIKVTLVEEEIEVNIDSYYVLYGDISGSSWDPSPSKDSQYALPYDSTLAGSRYWTRTITTESPSTYDPGFRIIEYGDYSSAVADRNSLDSASTGISSETDSDNNIKLDSKNTQYDITIDMRSSTPSILVNYHSDSFEAGIDGKYDDSSSGGSSSGGSSSESGLWVSGSAFTGATVDKIDAIASNDDYIMGADMSSIVEVLDAGGVFYDYSGNAITNIDDFMKFMADQGINYARIRLWNNPYNSSSNASYGGGGNDLNRDLTIAKAAVQAGMKICLDFHYSDFWADRERQYAPSTWSTYSGTSLTDAAAKFTSDTLTAFKDAGCTPSMVQVGNETNNNSICGTSGTSFFSACCSAVRTFATQNSTDIKIVIHHSDDQSVDTISSYITALTNANVDFDIIGLSFYPFWHKNGNISTLQSDIESLKSKFTDKEVCLMEYSYGWTTDYTSWGSQYGNMSNTFNDSLASFAGYDATPQGQANAVHDINEAVANGGGIGSFYWEPAWLSKQGTSWAATASQEFYTTHGVNISGWSWDTTSWANQAFFDYDGYALQSLKVFYQMKNGVDYSSEEYVSGDLDITASVYAYSTRESQLPTTTDIYTNKGSIVPCTISWDENDLATLESAVGGSTVTIKGTVTFNGTTVEVTGTITIINEYIRNGGFEEGTEDRATYCDGWTFTGSGGRIRNSSGGTVRSGTYFYDPWLANAFECGIYQEVGNISEGKYTLGVYYCIGNDNGISLTLYASINGEKTSIELTDGVINQYVYGSLSFEVTTSASVIVGLDVVGQANGLAYVDDFSMQYVSAV